MSHYITCLNCGEPECMDSDTGIHRRDDGTVCPDPRDAEIARLRAVVAKWEALHADNVGALDDAGVRRNEDDEIASGIQSLARWRDEAHAEVVKARELAAAVVQSHDASGGCRGPVGFTAMGNLAEWLHTTESEE